MALIIATRNPAKLERYRRALAQFPGLDVRSPLELALDLAVLEDGLSAAENACLKARAYAAHSGLPALGVDEALFIPAVPPDQQPGVLVRRSGRRVLSDEALLSLFLAKARGLAPEQRAVEWLYALCLALPRGEAYHETARWRGWLSDQACRPYPPGYPLSALLRDACGTPLTRLSEPEARQREQPVYQAVARLVGQRLCSERLGL